MGSITDFRDFARKIPGSDVSCQFENFLSVTRGLLANHDKVLPKDLHFYARSYQKPKNGSKNARVTAITVVLTIAKKDANGQSVTLCTQKAIIALPGEPVYIEKPGTWDGKASSES